MAFRLTNAIDERAAAGDLFRVRAIQAEKRLESDDYLPLVHTRFSFECFVGGLGRRFAR